MTDAIPQAIVVQRPDGTPIYANKVTLEYTGLTLEDVQAEGFRERIFHPHDLERARDELEKALAIGEPFGIEQRTRRSDGEYRWFLIRYNPLRDDNGHVIRWYATGTDIEDRKQAEEKMRNENLALREVIADSSMFDEIVGSSESLRRVLSQVAKVARTDSTVLILGETGTGKELIASAIHKRSNRSSRAFIRVNCAAIPSALIASELFGHEKGAFTGHCSGAWEGLKLPPAVRYSWTRSVTCQGRLSLRCCECSRSENLNASGATSQSQWMCAWWPPRTGT
jgi:formate hydrogenlyase transcriptional activator